MDQFLFLANVIVGGFLKNKVSRMDSDYIPYINFGLNTIGLTIKNMAEGKPFGHAIADAAVQGATQAFLATGVHKTGAIAQRNISIIPGHEKSVALFDAKVEAKRKVSSNTFL